MARHTSFCMTDYFVLSKRLVNMCNCKYKCNTQQRKEATKPLNTLWLQDKEFKNSIERGLKQFFEENAGSTGSLREASKAFICVGWLVTEPKKEKGKTQSNILEKQLAKSVSNTVQVKEICIPTTWTEI